MCHMHKIFPYVCAEILFEFVKKIQVTECGSIKKQFPENDYFMMSYQYVAFDLSSTLKKEKGVKSCKTTKIKKKSGHENMSKVEWNSLKLFKY